MSTVCPLEVCWLVRQKLDRRADVSGLPDMLELEVELLVWWEWGAGGAKMPG